MSNIRGSAATPNDHEPTGITRARERDQLWRDAPPSARHRMADGRRAVLAWTDYGTALVPIDTYEPRS